MEQVLYQLPEGWKWETLTDVTQFVGGSQPPKSEFSDTAKDGYVRLIQIRDYKTDAHIVYVDRNSTKKFCNRDDVMIGRYGPPVFQILRGIEGAYNVALMKAVPDEKILSKDYLFAFLQSSPIQSYIVGLSQRAAGQSGVNKKALENYSIPIPPMAEQKRIVEKLDALLTRIDTAIEHLQESVTLKNSLFQSALDGQFSAITERMTIESLAEVKGGKRLPKGEKLSDEETEHPYIRVADFTDKGTIDLSSIKYVSKEIHEQIKRYVISKDDLYISIAGTIGKTGFVPPELDGANLTENAAKLVIRDKQQLDLSYLYLFTLTSDFSVQAGLATKTVAQPKLALTRLSKIEIPMCSLEEQKSLVSTIEALKSKIHDAEAVLLGKIEDLKSLKASILDSAFKGEL
ncbi:MAG: restriction endonuclease subunit S [Pseudoalteromonas sp.]|nr:restriction endonuclease subunit S [Pseudoalteromonas sp.]